MSTEKKQDKLEAKNLEWLEYIKGNDTCRKPGCYGRGWTGFNVNGTPIMCSCALVSTPSQVNILKGQQDLNGRMETLAQEFKDVVKELKGLQSWTSSLHMDLKQHINSLIESTTFRSQVRKEVRRKLKEARHGKV